MSTFGLHRTASAMESPEREYLWWRYSKNDRSMKATENTSSIARPEKVKTRFSVVNKREASRAVRFPAILRAIR